MWRKSALSSKLIFASSATTWLSFVTISGLTSSSEQSSAATLLQLDHLRTSQENTSDSVSTTRHPIWNNVWTGAPLLDNAAFDRSTG